MLLFALATLLTFLLSVLTIALVMLSLKVSVIEMTLQALEKQWIVSLNTFVRYEDIDPVSSSPKETTSTESPEQSKKRRN